MSSAFRGGPGLGEFLNESQALSGVDGDAWENLLNSSSVNADSPGTSWYPRESKVPDSLWTHFSLSQENYLRALTGIRQTNSRPLSVTTSVILGKLLKKSQFPDL